MDAVTTRDADDPTTGPSLVFDEKAHAHSVAEDVLGILTGTVLVSLGLHLLHAAHAVTGGTAGLSLLLGYATAWPFWLLAKLFGVRWSIIVEREGAETLEPSLDLVGKI